MHPRRTVQSSMGGRSEEREKAMEGGALITSAAGEYPGAGPSQPRHLLIISRHHPGLYDYVRARFAEEDNVEVVLDRRRGRDRRRRASHPAVDRRGAERRAHAQVDAALRMESMQFVTIPPGPGPAGSRATEGEATAV